MKRWSMAVLTLMLALAAAMPAWAQGGGASSTGTIQGRITDAQGAVLPGVTVTATSPSLLGQQTTVSSETGNYRFPAVPPGTYTVAYELAGFNTLRREGVSITLGFTANLNVELTLATLQETVTVTGASPVIDTTSTRVQQNFKLEQLQSIPNGRDMWSLLAVTPAVQMARIDVERHDYLDFLDATCGYKYEYFKLLRNLDAAALDFLNVRYVAGLADGSPPGDRWRLAYSGADGRLWENSRVVPRAFSPATVRLVAPRRPLHEPLSDANAAFGPEAFASIAANSDWAATAWILSDRDAEEPNSAAEISDYRETTNEAVFTARSGAAPSWIVLSLVQDGGWSARLEDAAGSGSHRGDPLAVTRANGPFLAMRVPAGAHRVRLRYRPPGWTAGLWIAAVTALLLLGGQVSVFSSRSRKLKRRPDPMADPMAVR